MREPRWLPKHIVLDSTELRTDIALTSTRADFLRAFCERYGSTVIVPQIVRIEVEDHIRSETARQAESLADAARTLDRYGATPPSGLEPWVRRRWVTEAAQQLTSRLEWLGAEDIALPNVSHDEVVHRLLARKRPFGSAKNRDTGYRDFLLWRSVLSLGGRTAFVTSNKRDFAEDGRLHPDLVRDCAVDGKDVRLFIGLHDLTDKILRPSFPTVEAADLLLNRDDQRRKMETFARDELTAEDLDQFLWGPDFIDVFASDLGVAESQIEEVDDFRLSSLDAISLENGPTDLRIIEESRVIASYNGEVALTVEAFVRVDGRGYEHTQGSVLYPSTRLEFTLDVSGAEVVPVTVSLDPP
jgi:hypothetical protein